MENQNRLGIILSYLKTKRVLVGLPLALFFIGVIYVALVRFGIVKDPFPLKSIPFLETQPTQPKVSIKTEYKNPFDKKTQYVNPFDTYKNPFVVAK
jgi:hypothetical protein